MESNFKFSDYANALKEAGPKRPKLIQNILWRAREDANIGFDDYVRLETIAEKNERRTNILKED